MALLDKIQTLKANSPLMVKKGDTKIPIEEVPNGTSIKIGVLTDGKWQNYTLPLDEEVVKVLITSKSEGEIFSLEWK